mmetsp:Transcript_21683/g.49106  ORF Transcript_21683/g.49106 Transcript_21683/m.49106 type:complete len:100 (-) Transcript_21683:33-332(-)
MAEDFTSTDDVATIFRVENGARRPGRLNDACGSLKDATLEAWIPALALSNEGIAAVCMKPETLLESSMTVEATTSNDDQKLQKNDQTIGCSRTDQHSGY